MRPVSVVADIDRPADDVFAYVADFEHNPRWQKGMRSCRWTSPAPHGVGATYDQVARFLGRDIVSSFRVVELEPGRRVKITSTVSPFPITETRIVERLDRGRSRVIAVVEGDASGFFRPAEPLLGRLVARSVRGDYGRRLKAQLEQGAPPTRPR